MASFDYNPITGQLDLVGSGGGSYIDGEVEYHSNLPVTVGTPAVNSAFLVRKGEGLYFISRKPAGIWVRELNNGNLDDWKYAGTFSDLYRDANFRIINDADTSKELAFSLSGITTGTTRTLTAPDASGTIARTEDFAAPPAIGNTTPNSGAFTTLNANNGTLTASAPVLDLAQTWNNAAVTFTGLRLNITDTASAAASNLLEIQVGGVTRMMLKKSGTLHLGQFTNSGFYTPAPAWHGSTAGLLAATNLAIGSTLDTILERDAADTLAQRRSTNPQTFRLYNTFTDASNYERGFMRWSSNVLQIGTEKAGTGSARDMQLLVDGTARLTVASNGTASINAVTTIQNANNLLINGGSLRFQASNGIDPVHLERDASDILALRRTTNGQTFRLYNTVSGTNNVNFDRVNFRWASNEFIIDAEAGGTGTLRGIKIGSATSSLLGFYGVTPVDQPTTVADPAGGGTIDTEARTAIGEVIDRLQELGLIA